MFQIDSHTKFTPASRIDPIVSLLKEKFEIGSLTYELSDCQKKILRNGLKSCFIRSEVSGCNFHHNTLCLCHSKCCFNFRI